MDNLGKVKDQVEENLEKAEDENLETDNLKVALCVTMAAILPSLNAELTVPGLGDFTCGEAAGLLPINVDITPEQCVAAQAAASVICGCPSAPDAATDVPEEATTVVDEETTGANVDPVVPTVPVEEETTAAVTDTPLEDGLVPDPTVSPAPSMEVDVDTNMPTSSNTGTEMPALGGAAEPPSPTSILTPFPTAEPTSAAYKAATSTVCGVVLGMLVASIM